ncbi:MAG TPA: SDR family oxidoreductase [Paludibacteraceae bacterium]|nr:SDR family oxidoreductase [Paludibacteraceae bacterium]HOL01030.1 SDR family oxidoreductase [Paludibacteraceae bacterium]HPO67852.1 SDR family oxidoreductase [Paludibacteraceae bacterium]
MEQKAILITGASSGIGLATALQLMEKGFRVYAASRHGGEYQKAKTSNGEIVPVKMDVNNEEDIKKVIEQILNENQSLYAVISNAGNGIAGAVEDTSIEEAKYQFETNFFGAFKVIKACLPIFRQQEQGKIIATSSVAAIVPIPFQSFYSASKAALLLLMQGLYMEVKSFGIECCTILPGDTKTNFTFARKYTKASQLPNSAYSEKMKKAVGKMEKDEQNGMSPEAIARAIVKEITKKHMKALVIPGFQYKAICWLFNRLPVKFRLWVVGLLY